MHFIPDDHCHTYKTSSHDHEQGCPNSLQPDCRQRHVAFVFTSIVLDSPSGEIQTNTCAGFPLMLAFVQSVCRTSFKRRSAKVFFFSASVFLANSRRREEIIPFDVFSLPSGISFRDSFALSMFTLQWSVSRKRNALIEVFYYTLQIHGR